MREVNYRWLTAEAAVIVSSILLAFSIEAWWENSLEREEEQVLLTQLDNEFQYNLQRCEIGLGFYLAKTEATTAILQWKGQSASEDEEAFDRLLGEVGWYWISRFSTGAVESITLGGKISLIENAELRTVIAGWRDELERFRNLAASDEHTHKIDWWPYLHENVSLTQLDQGVQGSGQPGIGGSYPIHDIPVLDTKQHSELLEDPKFVAIVTHILWDQDNMVIVLNELVEKMKQARQLIRRELEG